MRFTTSTPEQRALLDALSKSLRLDVWSHGSTEAVDIRIPPELMHQVQQATSSLPSSVLVENVQDLVDQEAAHSSAHSARLSGSSDLTAATVFSDYQDAATYVSFLSSLPGATVITLPGKTYEGRSIQGVKFGTGAKQIVMNGGIHAREWISSSVVTQIANFLLSSDANAAKFLSAFTFHIIPVLNVDGYAYTRSPSGDRMWRKNREPNAGSSCVGTDPNRNWPTAWSKSGASGDECADDYYGPSAGSSAEVKAIIGYLQSLKNVVGYWDFHAYSQLWMWPYGYKYSTAPDNAALAAADAGKAAVAALKAVNGISFKAGPIASTIYQASGSSVDHTYDALKIKFSNAIELRDTGNNGFVLPASQIVPSGQEIIQALTSYFNYMISNP
ncbi:hypothetical protein HDU91_007138 [Kappamyces sp. JEL0680]|nr:hypothetical protein HDU91_007138 [Kappamyces sp. JEL0680]